jgi:hypothetical protein
MSEVVYFSNAMRSTNRSRWDSGGDKSSVPEFSGTGTETEQQKH